MAYAYERSLGHRNSCRYCKDEFRSDYSKVLEHERTCPMKPPELTEEQKQVQSVINLAAAKDRRDRKLGVGKRNFEIGESSGTSKLESSASAETSPPADNVEKKVKRKNRKNKKKKKKKKQKQETEEKEEEEEEVETEEGQRIAAGDGEHVETEEGRGIAAGDGEHVETEEGRGIAAGDGEHVETEEGRGIAAGDGEHVETEEGRGIAAGDGEHVETEEGRGIAAGDGEENAGLLGSDQHVEAEEKATFGCCQCAIM